jgi:hypothetical protein
VTLVVVAEPETESELAVMLCVLEGECIEAFVQGGALAVLFPGPRISSCNARRILVNTSDREAAVSALEVLRPPLPDRMRLRDKLRIVVETFFLFGWFVPGTRQKREDSADAVADEPAPFGE